MTEQIPRIADHHVGAILDEGMKALFGDAEDTVYPTSPIKRGRATKVEVEARRKAILDLVLEMQPMSVRQVFYQASVRGWVEKTEAGYSKVQNDLVLLRRSGRLPYDAIADNTRWQRKPRTYLDPEHALKETARLYRRSLWAEANAYCEVWLEKDALAGVVLPITALYDVPLMVSRGYASLSFLSGAADYIADLDVPVFLYHLGDLDPSGVDAGNKIEATLKELAPNADITFERIGVLSEQVEAMGLPTRPTKTTDSRAKHFKGDSVELDAIDPDTLRSLVEGAINRHLPEDQLRVLRAVEDEERRLIHGLAGMLNREGAA